MLPSLSAGSSNAQDTLWAPFQPLICSPRSPTSWPPPPAHCERWWLFGWLPLESGASSQVASKICDSRIKGGRVAKSGRDTTCDCWRQLGPSSALGIICGAPLRVGKIETEPVRFVSLLFLPSLFSLLLLDFLLLPFFNYLTAATPKSGSLNSGQGKKWRSISGENRTKPELYSVCKHLRKGFST